MGKGELRMMMRMCGMMIEKSVEMEVMAHEMRYMVGEGMGGWKRRGRKSRNTTARL